MRDDIEPLSPALLLSAYASGVFPMSEGRDDPEIFWVDPKRRGVFPLDGFHISRSLARKLKREVFHVTYNADFAAVVDACADRDETWINDTIRDHYVTLHNLGFGQSIEVWDAGHLVGGVYGVTLGAAFFGESMFSRATDASKYALAHLAHHLRRTGYVLFDTQFLTPHLASLGAIEISRASYRSSLSEAIELTADYRSVTRPATGDQVVQRTAQTS